MKFFLDTYAMVEIIKGNKNYEKYTEEELYTTIFNLYELYYNLLKQFDVEQSKEFYYYFYDFLISITDEDIFEGAKIKQTYNARDISYTDALGYVIANKNHFRFLTGDKAFADLENVEYVK